MGTVGQHRGSSQTQGHQTLFHLDFLRLVPTLEQACEDRVNLAPMFQEGPEPDRGRRPLQAFRRRRTDDPGDNRQGRGADEYSSQLGDADKVTYVPHRR